LWRPVVFDECKFFVIGRHQGHSRSPRACSRFQRSPIAFPDCVLPVYAHFHLSVVCFEQQFTTSLTESWCCAGLGIPGPLHVWPLELRLAELKSGPRKSGNALAHLRLDHCKLHKPGFITVQSNLYRARLCDLKSFAQLRQPMEQISGMVCDICAHRLGYPPRATPKLPARTRKRASHMVEMRSKVNSMREPRVSHEACARLRRPVTQSPTLHRKDMSSARHGRVYMPHGLQMAARYKASCPREQCQISDFGYADCLALQVSPSYWIEAGTPICRTPLANA
jgi:hypothetical protein